VRVCHLLIFSLEARADSKKEPGSLVPGRHLTAPEVETPVREEVARRGPSDQIVCRRALRLRPFDFCAGALSPPQPSADSWRGDRAARPRRGDERRPHAGIEPGAGPVGQREFR
jgi:hypothetical protein